jgi:FkbM family methyltransferase
MFIKEVLAKSFLFNLFTLARFSHAKKYLLKACMQRPDPYQSFVLAKNKERSLCIWALQQIKHRERHLADDLYYWKLNGEKWLASLDHVHGLYEYLNGSFETFYQCDYRGKTVLDIGGYIGDSARFFLKKGARKVIVFEPCEKNVFCMRENLKGDADAVEIICKAIAAQNGERILSSNYPEGHIGFGNREGRYQVKVQGESFTSILTSRQADIAKIDCEGNESYLLSVESSLLRRIPYWIIEVHNGQIAYQMDQKFLAAGFQEKQVFVPEHHQSVKHYFLFP